MTNIRDEFPRLYFLSNEGLLDLLLHSEDIDVINMHLKSLFDDISEIDVQGQDILAMISREGERVPFTEPVKKSEGIVA